jgi:hypothetical protein
MRVLKRIRRPPQQQTLARSTAFSAGTGPKTLSCEEVIVCRRRRGTITLPDAKAETLTVTPRSFEVRRTSLQISDIRMLPSVRRSCAWRTL